MVLRKMEYICQLHLDAKVMLPFDVTGQSSTLCESVRLINLLESSSLMLKFGPDIRWGQLTNTK